MGVAAASSIRLALCLSIALLLACPAFAAKDAAKDATTPPPALPWQLRLSLTPAGALSLHWLSKSDQSETVELSEWGATGIVQRIKAEVEISEPLGGVHARHALFPALRPGGSYLYRLPELPAVPFRAPAQDGSPVSVLLMADMGTWGTVTDVIKSLGRALEGELLLHLGDLSYAQDTQTWDKWADLLSNVLRSRPWLFVPGNWDAKPFAWPTFLQRFYSPLLPSPSVYHYSFTYQRLRFVMLNSYEPFNDGSEQYEWLSEQLRVADTPQQRKLRPWVIVCFHSPMYSSSTGHGGGDEKFRTALEPLLLAHHVDLCFTGHDHGYERSYPVRDGTTIPHARGPHFASPLGAPVHVLVGTAGATHDPWMEPQPAWSAHRELSHGYTRLRSFANDSLVVEFVRINDTVGDRFVLTRKSGNPSSAVGGTADLDHLNVWNSFVPSGPFLAMLLAGFALPSLIIIKYLQSGRHHGVSSSYSTALSPFAPNPIIRRSSSSFLLRDRDPAH